MHTVKTERMEQVLRGAIAVLMIAFVWVVYDAVRERLVVVGDSAPDFSVTTDSGRKISVSDFGGKLLVLNFWATWCPPCIEEIPSLNRLHETMASKGVVVLGISVDQNEDQYKQFLKNHSVTFQTHRDPEHSINLEYGTVMFPETYIIGRDGKVLRKIISSRNWMDPAMLSDLESLL